jgi:DNA-binding response OmpR family regulator
LEVLTRILSDEGYAVVSADIDDLMSNEKGLDDFLEAHEPSVVLFDVGHFEGAVWRFYANTLRARRSARSRSFILMTTAKRELRALVGLNGAVILDKPFNMSELLSSTRVALTTSEAHLAPRAGRIAS